VKAVLATPARRVRPHGRIRCKPHRNGGRATNCLQRLDQGCIDIHLLRRLGADPAQRLGAPKTPGLAASTIMSRPA
jgi:hypothetical protein